MAFHGIAWHGLAWHGMLWHGMGWHDLPCGVNAVMASQHSRGSIFIHHVQHQGTLFPPLPPLLLFLPRCSVQLQVRPSLPSLIQVVSLPFPPNQPPTPSPRPRPPPPPPPAPPLF
ncbi:unnamed protein product [Closterium sp. NIES-54]